MNLAPLENLRGNYASMASDWTVPPLESPEYGV